MEYDEFGFKIEVEDGPEQCSSKLLSTPFSDNHQQKLKWIAHLVKVIEIFLKYGTKSTYAKAHMI